jgi:hypothetical protein
MPEDQNNIALERLREIGAMLAQIQADTADTRLRVGMLDTSVSIRLDQIAADVERIKRRLDLVETP